MMSRTLSRVTKYPERDVQQLGVGLSILLALLGSFLGCGSDNEGRCVMPLLSNAARGCVLPMTVGGFRSGRQLYVYLPAGYDTSGQLYPVVFMLDGETCFGGSGSLRANEVADTLIASRRIPPFVMVAIVSAPGADRMYEYTPWPGSFPSDPPGGGGNQFLIAIRDSLLPPLRHAVRIASGPENTYLTGTSLGGLLSAYGGLAFDSTFGGVGALSPPYAYAGGAILTYTSSSDRGGLYRFYQDTGTINDNSRVVLELMATELETIGFVRDCDLMSVVADGGAHDTQSWSKRLPATFAFFFAPLDSVHCTEARFARQTLW